MIRFLRSAPLCSTQTVYNFIDGIVAPQVKLSIFHCVEEGWRPRDHVGIEPHRAGAPLRLQPPAGYTCRRLLPPAGGPSGGSRDARHAES